MFEHHSVPLLPRRLYYKRLTKSLCLSSLIICLSLFIGILGYHLTEHLNWLDSLLNASMILGGMGPVDRLVTPFGKMFASFYALFSGIVFLATIAVALAPVLHRFLHKFHLDEKK